MSACISSRPFRVVHWFGLGNSVAEYYETYAQASAAFERLSGWAHGRALIDNVRSKVIRKVTP